MSFYELCSLLTSACALFLTAVFAHIGWRHQRLSARPHCHFVTVSSCTDNHKIGLYLRNNGPGVAIIRRWKFSVLGIPVGENRDGMVEAKMHLGGVEVGRYWIEPGDSLQANSVEKILWREPSPGDVSNAKDNLFKKRLDDIEITLTVASVYEEEATIRFSPKTSAV